MTPAVILFAACVAYAARVWLEAMKPEPGSFECYLDEILADSD